MNKKTVDFFILINNQFNITQLSRESNGQHAHISKQLKKLIARKLITIKKNKLDTIPILTNNGKEVQKSLIKLLEVTKDVPNGLNKLTVEQ